MGDIFYGKMQAVVFGLFVCAVASHAATTTVYYAASSKSESRVVNAGMHISGALSADRIGDVYARVSGLPPLLREEEINPPSLDILSDYEEKERPVLLGVCGLEEPLHKEHSMTSLLSSSVSHGVPSVTEVKKGLKANGLDAMVYEIESNDRVEVEKWIKTKTAKGKKAAVVVQASSCAKTHNGRRKLEDSDSDDGSSSSSDKKGPTIVQIEEFQVSLWTTFLLIGALFAAISSLTNMEVKLDSLLTAKFQSSRTKND